MPTVHELVEALGGHQAGSGWQCHCPAHDDPTPSLSVTEKGGKVLLHCHAGCPQKAVIAALTERNLWPIGNGQKPSPTMKEKKHPAVIPVPEAALKKLNPITKSRWTLEHRGQPAGGWKYHDAQGKVEFCVVRYDSERGKAVIPYYWDGSTWREGQARKDDRPLYHLPEILADHDTPILVVEGEKCADIQVPGYILTTWAGGSTQVTKTDWSPLAKREVLVWPDADETGSKAAIAIKRRLPHARILNIQDRPQGWDIADAVAEGLDPVAYIAGCPLLETAEPEIPATEFTDIANAERFFRECGDRVHYCTVARAWYYWSGKVWAEDDNQVVASWAKRTAKNIYEQAWTYTDPNLAKKAIACKSRAKIEAMLALSKSEGHIPIRPTDMDPDPWAWNCDNGIMDLQNIGFLQPHDQTRLHTKISPIAFDDGATCPRWDDFLLEIMSGDAEMVAFLQRIAGYAMTGDMRERKYFTFYGHGNNGKSVLTELLAHVWGDYAATALRDTFLRNKTESVQHDIARIRGARLVFVAETSEGAALDEELVKQWVGQDTLAGRFLYGKAFDFRPVGKLIIRTNYRPRIKGQDAGIWGRSLFVEFPERFEGGREDKTLRDKLMMELPGIMRWCLVGCAEWKNRGLDPPQKVLADGAEYREQQDDIADFFLEYLIREPAQKISNQRLYELYRAWCEKSGISRPWNNVWFGRKMAERGYQQSRDASGNRREWFGIGEK